MEPLNRLLSFFIMISLLLSLFVGPVKSRTLGAVRSSAVTQSSPFSNDESGLQFRLSQGQEQPQPNSPTKQAPATHLSQSETEKILERLPPMKVEQNNIQEFARREGSLAPPVVGEIVKSSFPTSLDLVRETINTGPVEVVRFSPEGAVAMAPQLSLTFSQPMVSLTSQDQAATNVPVKLTPQPAGKWRWLGTKTLVFEPVVRFPMATTYIVSVPEGTRSANGSTLAEEKSWSFTTPAPSVKTSYPANSDTYPRDSLMFLEFDQEIDPAAVLSAVRVTQGNRTLPVRLATNDEIKQTIESGLAGYGVLAHAVKNRWVAFRAVDPVTGKTDLALPSASRISVSLISGAPSAEGPNRTRSAYKFSFSTYGPLAVTDHGCNDEAPCKISNAFDIEFSNELSDDFEQSQIRVEPALPELETRVYGSSLSIDGLKQGNTTYKVTLDKSIKDKFNQELGRDLTFTFKVGPSPRKFVGPDDFQVLDPAAPTRCPVFSINFTQLKVRLYSVTPEDWPHWLSYQEKQVSSEKELTPPGRLVLSKTIGIEAAQNEIAETLIDLSPALTNGKGQVLLILEPIGGKKTDDDVDSFITRSWIQVTSIGLDAFVDRSDIVSWVTSLKDGTPLSNVQVSLFPAEEGVRSDGDGLARLSLKSAGAPDLIVARRDGDVAILPRSSGYWDNGSRGWVKETEKDSLRWYVFDDRKMYQPSEEVHVKGWIRKIGAGKLGDTDAPPASLTQVAYILTDSRGTQLKVGSIPVNALGGFDWTMTLPDKLNLGDATLKLQALSSLEDNTYNHQFQVQEFRRPEFEVKTKLETEGPSFVGSGADVSLNANYYAGGGLVNAAVTWNVSARTTSFTPPNRSDYNFGRWTPWWQNSNSGESTSQTLQGVTDVSGKHLLHLDFDRVDPAVPSLVTASASVADVNRQRWSSEATFLVHPADLYVGLKSDKTFVERGQPLQVQAIVSDLDGELKAGHEIKMIATRLSWRQQNGEWTQLENDPQECVIKSSLQDAARCTFSPIEGGEYRVRATIHDDRERRNESQLNIWVSGAASFSGEELEEDTIKLIPDKKEYRAGEIAEVLVQSPFYPAEGVLTVRRSGMQRVERFKMDQSTTTLRVPIEEGWAPNVQLNVNLLGEVERETNGDAKSARSLPKKPAFASAQLHLAIPPLDRRLSVRAIPSLKSLAPGGETQINVDVKDAQGKPVNRGEVAVVVVDEAVLALTDYKIADPISIFYPQRQGEVVEYHLRENVWEASLKSLYAEAARGGGGGSFSQISPVTLVKLRAGIAPHPNMVAPGEVSMDASPIQLRKDFNALAVFAPSVPIDANGRAEVKVKLPDNLTRYRVMAVAVSGGKQFGSGESSITARMPLMVRASAPRFLNFGDAFEFPVVVQNQTDESMQVDVAMRAVNVRLSPGSPMPTSPVLAGRRVTVAANDRVELRIPISTANAGTAKFQIAAVSGRWTDATEVSLPVWTPAPTEAFATYGEIDRGGIAQPVKAPGDVFQEFGGLEVETSSTQLQQLTDAFLYLQNYPYECSEQLSSRILSVAALKDVLQAFKAKGLPTPSEIEAAVTRDLGRLEKIQNDDGGFGFWKRGEKSWPFLSIHAGHALARAREKGFPVSTTTQSKALNYLRSIDSLLPSDYSPTSKQALRAYALFVRMQLGDRDLTKVRRLVSELPLENSSAETIGWLLSVLAGDTASQTQIELLLRHFNNRVTETAGTAHFITTYGDDDHLLLNSDRRADAVILEALIAAEPGSDLIPKLVRGLLGHRSQGRWSSTQENVFVLLALDRYFKTYEKVSPAFVARIWLDKAYAGQQSFQGRSLQRQSVEIPMKYLASSDSASSLVIDKQGEGRLYYRLAMNYSPRNLNMPSADYGFAVERTYEAIDDPADIQRDADGSWLIKAGARVRVRLTMDVPSRRYHVALVDYLAAGFESINPELAVTEQIPEDRKLEPRSNSWRWNPVWFDHQNLRSERSEVFSSLLWGGVYNYSYVVRATTPGSFIVPPAKAEEMYHPETFGRSSSDRVRIE